MYLNRNQILQVFNSHDENFRSILTFNNISYKQILIENLLEITQFAVRYFKLENKANDTAMVDVGDFEDVQLNMERLLLLNLNQNF